MFPKGVITAYRMRMAYLDVISRQGPPKATNFSWISLSVASCPIARTCLKAGPSANDSASVNPGEATKSRSKIMGYKPQGRIQLRVSRVSSTKMSCGSQPLSAAN